MIARVRPSLVPLLVTVAAGVLALFSMFGITVLAGTKTGTALTLAAGFGPLALYAAICEPLVFPFAFFVLLVPFDNLLSVPAFGTLTRGLAIISGASIVFWLLRTRQAVLPGRGMLFWMLFVLWAFASTAWALDPAMSGPHLFTLIQLVALVGVLSFVPIEARTLRLLAAMVVASGVVAALYGVDVFRHGADVSSNGRLFLSVDNGMIDPNHFAAALILPIALSFSALLRTRSLAVKAACIVSLGALGGGIAVSSSRGGLLAVIVVVLYIFFRMRARVLTAGISVAALGTALALYGNVFSRFSNAASSGGAGRVDIWRVGLQALRAHPLFGAGIGNFPLAFDQAFLQVSEHYYTHWHRDPHNILISTSVELGIVGAGLMLCAWWFSLRSMRGIPRTAPLFVLRTGVEAALLGLFSASMFLDTLESKYLWLAFALAVLVRNAALLRSKGQRERYIPTVLPAAPERT